MVPKDVGAKTGVVETARLPWVTHLVAAVGWFGTFLLLEIAKYGYDRNSS